MYMMYVHAFEEVNFYWIMDSLFNLDIFIYLQNQPQTLLIQSDSLSFPWLSM